MLQPGTIFDSRYELVRLIGRGGFAEVWLVKDSLTGLEEALKIYAPGSGMDEDGLKVFVKELIVAHDLHHPHLLTPNMLGQYERQPYLIMQYCPNGSLNKKVGKCTEEEAWKILEHVASGLAYLHEQGVVHQDIKPDNILVDTKGNYVITDFGISLRAKTTLRKSMRAQANSGTMAYMAPERFSAEPHPMSANDIWSLGAMMFEIIEGKVPFEEQGGGKQKSGADIPTMHADVSDNLKQVIRSLLALDPEERPTAAELVELIMSKRTQRITPCPEPETKPEPKPQNGASSTEAGKGSSSARKWAFAICMILSIIVMAPVVETYVRTNETDLEVFNPKDALAMAVIPTKTQVWVDLGLPSGTLWAIYNEEGGDYSDGLFTYSQALSKYGDQLPTKAQLEELCYKCQWQWNGYGYNVTGPNGVTITLPLTGYYDSSGTLKNRYYAGNYWSREIREEKRQNAWKLYFRSDHREVCSWARNEYHAVRLVK
ncbi:MAG: serine/threonine protein kinase [Paludibacteraceae bacterium]|nr:serine/threonine protein kinase [Paludibacteraceae bacterium]